MAHVNVNVEARRSSSGRASCLGAPLRPAGWRFNPHFDVVTVVPITQETESNYLFEVRSPDLVGMGFESIVMRQQVRTISKLRLLERIGVLSDEAIRDEIESRLLEHLGIPVRG